MGRVAYDLAHILLIRCHPPGNTCSLTRGVPACTAAQLLQKPSSLGALKSAGKRCKRIVGGENLFTIHLVIW